METDVLIIILSAVLIVGAFLYFKKDSGKKNSDDLASLDLSKRIDALNQNVTGNLNTVTKSMLDQLDRVKNQVDLRLKENFEMMQRQHKSVGERLDNAGKVINNVISSISKMEESNKRVYDIAKDLSSLQDILKAPKLRGGLGELFLEELLAQIFSKDQYTLQHRFKSGEIVDAVIRLRDGQLVPVDAKFPLENFKKMLEHKDPKEQEKLRKIFTTDVKKHIDAIAKKYILPDEGTFDFALMYIPAENVYYEMIVKDESEESIASYGLQRHVIPVSPNSFNIYLHTILLGLRGLQIEKSAKDILGNLTRLKTDFERFGEDYQLVGKHLSNARTKFEDSEKRLDRLNDRFGQIAAKEEPVPTLPDK